MTNQEIATRLVAVIRVLATSRAITDTLWMPHGITLADELATIAGCCGATDEEIVSAIQGRLIP